jgi:CBS domain-containing protein
VRGAGHYRSEVVRIAPDAAVAEAAQRMDRFAVGCLVVVDAGGATVGILTDRDLLRRVVAAGGDRERTRVADVMTRDPVHASPREPLERLLERMRGAGVRRLPILEDGRLVGLVSLDDVVAALGRELGDVRAALRDEVLGSRRGARRRRRREELEEALETLRGGVGDVGQQVIEWLQREVEGVRERLRDRRS